MSLLPPRPFSNNEPGLLQDLQVLGQPLTTEIGDYTQLCQRLTIKPKETVQDGSPTGIGQCFEYDIQGLHYATI